MNEGSEEAVEMYDPPKRLTSEELTALARNIVTNVTYITNSEEGIEYSFKFILMMAMPHYTHEALEQIGAVYEDWAKAGPRSINGFPFFFSCKLLHKDDLEPLWAEVARMREALGVVAQ